MAELRAAVAGAVHGFAHVTGGGIAANLARVVPPACRRGGAVGLVARAADLRRGAVAGRGRRRRDGAGVQPRHRHDRGAVARGRADAALDVLGDAHVIGEVVAGSGQVVLDRA